MPLGFRTFLELHVFPGFHNLPADLLGRHEKMVNAESRRQAVVDFLKHREGVLRFRSCVLRLVHRFPFRVALPLYTPNRNRPYAINSVAIDFFAPISLSRYQSTT